MSNDKPRISLVVPYRAKKGSLRARNWEWLEQYWKYELPEAEVIVSDSGGRVFSKTVAVNKGILKSRGNIIVILDADCYISGAAILEAADRIEYALSRGQRRWYMPYDDLYRLNEETTEKVLASYPWRSYPIASPPDPSEVEDTAGSMDGKRYGALIQIIPREAFDIVGGMDPRFRGWGGEDVAHARALDTLYGKHKITRNQVTHLWHQKIGATFKTRKWKGQKVDQPNGHLASRYSQSTGDPEMMRKVVNEGIAWGKENSGWRSGLTQSKTFVSWLKGKVSK